MVRNMHRVFSIVVVVFGIALAGGWSAFQFVLLVVGASTLPEDYQLLVSDKLPRWLDWLFGTPWYVPGLIFIALTLWLIWITRPTHVGESAAGEQQVKSKKPDQIEAVATDLDFTVAPLRRVKKALDGGQEQVKVDDVARYAMAFRGALLSLEKRGFTVPWIDFQTDPVGYVETSVSYVDRVLPLLERGHIKEAKAISAEQTIESKRLMAAREKL